MRVRRSCVFVVIAAALASTPVFAEDDGFQLWSSTVGPSVAQQSHAMSTTFLLLASPAAHATGGPKGGLVGGVEQAASSSGSGLRLEMRVRLGEPLHCHPALSFETAPSPADQTELASVAWSGVPGGPIAAAGRTRMLLPGGSPSFPFLIEQPAPGEAWVVHDTPDFGFTWHFLRAVLYLPEKNRDLVVIGQYNPDFGSAQSYSFVMRYDRAEDHWETFEIVKPGAFSTWVRSAILDPRDPDRLLLFGTWSIGGWCFEPRPILVEFDLASNTHSFMDLGDIRGTIDAMVVLEDGSLLATGIGATQCDYTFVLQVLRVEDGVVSIMPSPPSLPGHPLHSLWGLTLLADGCVLAVGHASQLPGSRFQTLSYRFDPKASEWEMIKPIDPNLTLPNGNYINQFFTIAQAPDGTVYAGGRTQYWNGLYKFQGMVQSFDGDTWHLHELPEFLSTETNATSQIWGLANTDAEILAVGWWRPDGSFDQQTLVLRAPNAGGAPGDLNCDGVVDVSDLLILLGAWGPCDDPEYCSADLDGDGIVGVADLLILFENWG
jgi:hypothetical protein